VHIHATDVASDQCMTSNYNESDQRSLIPHLSDCVHLLLVFFTLHPPTCLVNECPLLLLLDLSQILTAAAGADL